MSGGYWVHWGDVVQDTCAANVYLNLATRLPVSISLSDGNYFKVPLPQVPDALALNALPDGPVLEWMHTVKDSTDINTNFFKLLEIPAGWREAHSPQLLKDAERVVTTLQWKSPTQKFSDMVEEVYVNPPAFGLGGRVGSSGGEVILDTKGKLKYFQHWPPGVTNYYQWLVHASCVISTNEAKEAAEQKLQALGFDLSRPLRRASGTNRPTSGSKVYQRPFTRSPRR